MIAAAVNRASATRHRVLVLATSDVARDARVRRQVRVLSQQYDVTCAAAGDPDEPGVEFVRLEMFPRPRRAPLRNRTLKAWRGLLLVLRRYDAFYWQQRWAREAARRLAGDRANLVLANDLDTLPLALRIAGRAPVLFDAHEYYPGQYDDGSLPRRLWRGYATAQCRRLLPGAAAMITVSPGIAAEYERAFAVRPEVVENCPEYADLQPKPVAMDSRIQLVHHGACRLVRGLDKLVELMDHLDDRFELNFMLTGDQSRGEYRRLMEMASGNPRIRFLDPVPVSDITATLNRFDLGVYLLDPICLNHRLALPNKFFDFIQARLGIAIGPSPEMARIVNEYGLGVVSEDFTPASLAARLNALSAADILQFKHHANRVAGRFSAARVGERLMSLVEKVIEVGSHHEPAQSRSRERHRLLRAFARQEWIRTGLRYRLLRRFTHWSTAPSTQFEVDFFGTRYRGDLSRHIDWHVYFFGAYEKAELLLLRDIAGAGRNAVAMDVGANVGQHSLFLSRHFEAVHAFEPYAAVRQHLEDKLAINRVSNVVVHSVGLGVENECRPYFAPESRNDGLGTFVAPDGRTAEGDPLLPLVAGDEYLQAAGVTRIDLIKLDVEGFERTVLKGMREALAGTRPVLLMELGPNARDDFGARDGLRKAMPPRYRVVRVLSKRPIAGLFNAPGYHFAPFDFGVSGNVLLWPEEDRVLNSLVDPAVAQPL